MADLYYYESGYIDDSYFVYTADASASPSSQFTVTAAVGVIKEADSSLVVTASVSSIISHIEGADLFAFSEAELSVAVDRITDNNIAASSAFNVAIDFVRTRTVTSDEAAEFTITAINIRGRDFESTQSAAFSLAADAEVIQGGVLQEANADLTVVANLSAINDKIVQTSSTQNASVSITAFIDGTLEGASTLTSTSSISATISHIEGADLTALSNASMAIDADRIRDYDSAIFAEATLTGSYKVKKEFASAYELSFFTEVIDFNRIRGFDSAQSSTASLSGTLDGTLEGASGLNSTATISATISHIHGADLTAFSDAALSVSGDKIRFLAGSLSSAFTQSVSVIRNPGAVANLSSAFTVYARPKMGVTWTDASGLNVPGSSSTGTSGAVIDTSVKKFGNGSLYVPAGTTKGIVATVNANELSIPSNASNISFSISFWYKGSSTSSNRVFYLEGSSASNYVSINLASNNVEFNYNPAGTVAYYYNTNSISGFTATNWNFIEFYGSPNSSTYRTLRLFVNGVEHDINAPANAPTYSIFKNAFDVTNLKAMIGGGAYDMWIDDFQFRTGSGSLIGTNAPTSQAVADSSTKTLLNLNSTFDDSTYVVTHSGNAVLDSKFSISAAGEKYKLVLADADVSSQFDISAINERILTTSSSISSEFTQNASVERTRDIESSLSVTATISTANDRYRDVSSNISAEFAQSSSIDKFTGYNADLSSESSLTTSISRTIEFSAAFEAFDTQVVAAVIVGDFFINCEVTASITADTEVTYVTESNLNNLALIDANASLVADGSTILADAFDINATGLRIKRLAATISATASIAATAIKVGVNSSILTSEFTLDVTVDKLVGVQADLSDEISLSAINEYIIGLTSDSTAEFTQTALATITRDVTANVDSSSSLTATISHIEGADIQVNGFATLTVSAFIGKVTSADLSTEFTISIDNERIRYNSTNANAQSTLAIDASKLQQLESNISSSFSQSSQTNYNASAVSNQNAVATLSAIGGDIKQIDLVAFSNASLSADVSKTTGFVIAATSAVNLAVTGTRIKTSAVNLAASTSLLANPTKAILGQGTLHTSSTIQAIAGYLTSASANINGAMSFAVDIHEIDIDSINQYVYIIPRESWTYTIQEENWNRDIPEETRIFTVRRA